MIHYGAVVGLDSTTPPYDDPRMKKITCEIALDSRLLGRMDVLVQEGWFNSRNELIETAVREHLTGLPRPSLMEACSALNPAEERAVAEEGIAVDSGCWPPY